jgi:hypothetical protein
VNRLDFRELFLLSLLEVTSGFLPLFRGLEPL